MAVLLAAALCLCHCDGSPPPGTPLCWLGAKARCVYLVQEYKDRRKRDWDEREIGDKVEGGKGQRGPFGYTDSACIVNLIILCVCASVCSVLCMTAVWEIKRKFRLVEKTQLEKWKWKKKGNIECICKERCVKERKY